LENLGPEERHSVNITGYAFNDTWVLNRTIDDEYIVSRYETNETGITVYLYQDWQSREISCGYTEKCNGKIYIRDW
jgi:hypothetical protein